VNSIKEISILFIVFVFLSYACSQKEKACDQGTITADIQMQKISNGCGDIDLLWDISFGASFEFEIDISCGENCDDQIIF